MSPDDARSLDPALYLVGERVRLRPFRLDDAPAMQRWVADPQVVRLVGGTPYPIPLPAEEAFVREGLEGGWERGFRFAIEAIAGDDAAVPRLIGSLALRALDAVARRGEIGILIGDRAYWNRGYGEDAMRTICRFGFRDLDLNRIELSLGAYNARARRAYEKVGFTLEGRLRERRYLAGRYYDTLLMGLLRDEFEAREAGRETGRAQAPPEPRPT